MPYSDDELLALHALGEPLPAEDRDHLAGCPTCQATLRSLRAVVTAVRPLADVPLDRIQPVQPPAEVWPLNGDPKHSRHSVLRGTLAT